MKSTETLLDCGHPESPHSSITSGYGVTRDGKKHCYACCARHDQEQMQRDGRATLYLTSKPDLGGDYGTAIITNWPGSLKYTGRYHKGRHNIAGTRYDVWFVDETGAEWWGVQYGEWTQICHCRKLKAKG